MSGVLDGYRVIELGGIGPVPMTGMIMADMGAEVILIERLWEPALALKKDASRRGKKSVAVDLTVADGRDLLLELVREAHVLIEGFRPGVTEKMGLGPESCRRLNKQLVYGRMTGYGQDGPLANVSGHDINYIAMTGALDAIGPQYDRPSIPLNLVGDMGGGGMLLAVGVLAALLETKNSGEGQVVDAAMVDGVAQLMWMIHSTKASGLWDPSKRCANLIDGGAPFYDTYETSDRKSIAFGAVEPQFYAELIRRLGINSSVEGSQMDSASWSNTRELIAEKIAQKPRDYWCEFFEGVDVCFSPVLNMDEAPAHPHNKHRNTYTEVDGFVQPSPAPRFGRTPSTVKHGTHTVGQDTKAVLLEFGLDNSRIQRLFDDGIIA